MTGSRILAIVALGAVLAASGCGRKAALDTPSQAAKESQESGGIGVNRPAPAPTPVSERRFILDSLI